MNTIASSQKNRRERIAEAMRIEWTDQRTGESFSDTYSTDLYVYLVDTIRGADMYDVEAYPAGILKHTLKKHEIYFGGSKHTLTLTQLEDLCELVRRSYHAQQEAKAVR